MTEEQLAGTTPETTSEADATEGAAVAEPATMVADVAAETTEPSVTASAEPVAEAVAEPVAEAVA